MATGKFDKLQRDFSGGEISLRMMMRDDLEVHGKACLTMQNMFPSLQGTALRSPGSRFLWEVVPTEGVPVVYSRIIPYITPNNNYALVEILPRRTATTGEIRIRQDIGAALNGIPLEGGVDPDAPQVVFKRIVNNDSFQVGLTDWVAVDEEYTGGGGDTLGIAPLRTGSISLQCRSGYSSKDNATVTLTTTAVIPEDTDQIQIVPVFKYQDNFTDVNLSKQTGSIRIGTTLGGNELWEEVLDDYEVGQKFDRVVPVVAALTAGTTIYLSFTVTAVTDEGLGSAPLWVMNQFRVLSKETVDVNSQTVTLTTAVDYLTEELEQLQYVQSPYYNSGNVAGTFGNELVLVHPNYPPKRLYFNGTEYVFEEIPFVYVNELGASTGDATELEARWLSDGYPATCTSYMGRLVLAGSKKDVQVLGSQTGSSTEAVWMTYVGKWNAFSDPANTTVTPSDSIEFSSTYRSPIQWVHGQSNLLLGSESYEYVSNSDGIYSPGDLGVFLQSTHGSERVQPTPMGQYVLFAAEQGSRVRAMQYVAESEYWVSPDMTLYHPDLFATRGGIRRMVRMRNPHQICACLMGNGGLALLHQDSYAGISAWSRSDFGGSIQDIAVIPQDDGTDVLYLLIRRTIEGVTKLYLEAMADWTYAEESNWNFTNSSVTFVPAAPTNVITGLDHLEGKIVQVVSDQSYIGSWTVTGGTVTMLQDGTGDAINVDNAVVGAAMTARLDTMPMITQDPGSKKRYGSLYVRCIDTARPIINGKRPPDRDPITPMGEAEGLDSIADYEDENFGWNRTQVVRVKENLPVRLEVMGIYGTVKTNSV